MQYREDRRDRMEGGLEVEGYLGDSQVEPAPVDLKILRRQFGLSQSNVADLLRVSQATVSRWERGVEAPCPMRRNVLIDILTNRKGRIDSIITQLIRGHPFVSIFDADLRFVHISDQFARLLRINKSDVVGQSFAEVAESEWFNEIYRDIPQGERVMVEFEHVLSGRNSVEGMPKNGVHTRDYWMELEGQPGTLVALVDVVPDTKLETKVIKKIDTSVLQAGNW